MDLYLSNGLSVQLNIRTADAHNTEVYIEGKFDCLVKISEPTLLGREHALLLDTFRFLILTFDHFALVNILATNPVFFFPPPRSRIPVFFPNFSRAHVQT